MGAISISLNLPFVTLKIPPSISVIARMVFIVGKTCFKWIMTFEETLLKFFILHIRIYIFFAKWVLETPFPSDLKRVLDNQGDISINF